jgi:CysZ protein
MRSLIDGFSYPLRAIQFIVRQPVLWRYIVMPIVLNIIVGLALYTTLLWAGFQAIETFLVGWPVWIEWFVRGLLVIALFFGAWIYTGALRGGSRLSFLWTPVRID